MHTAAVIALVGSSLALSFGTARLFGWVIARRDARVDSAYRAARLVAVSKAEVIRE